MIAAFILSGQGQDTRLLLLKRRPDDPHAPGSWQILYGHIESGETVEKTLVRELREETGLEPESLWTLNETLQFYDKINRVIAIVPVFVIIPRQGLISIDKSELSDFRWVSINEAYDMLIWNAHIRMLDIIKSQFINRTPSALLSLR